MYILVVGHFDLSIIMFVSSDNMNCYKNNSMVTYIGRKYIVLDNQTKKG